MCWSGCLSGFSVVVVFGVGGAAVAQGGMQPGAVVLGDVVHGRAVRCGPGGAGPGLDQLTLEDEKNNLATALSQHCPLRPADSVTWQSPASSANAAEVYWQPRSEWKTTPRAGTAVITR